MVKGRGQKMGDKLNFLNRCVWNVEQEMMDLLFLFSSYCC